METTVDNVVHLTTQEFKEKVFNYEKTRNGNMKASCLP